ncbi:hypothetical protein Cgig2_014483 [Carnegiea gigantea]|uniref:Retrotransposon gag domain-containing protein n=1 Tax=Carnegiea gigantea TaxID=171969 RepID=A0A9Q1JX11_9CARY|nr:hypothetical protein Cgig2_014483 [Carnegiea gigantea]
MMDTITRPVSEHVKRAMEAANLARPLPHFDYIPINGRKSSHRQERVPSPCYTEWEQEVRGHPMLRRPPPMTARPKPQNARRYCKFYEQSGYTTTECLELKKALHELTDKGQIDRFLKRGTRFLQPEQEPAQPQLRNEECSIEVVATVVGGYAEGMIRSAWKVQFRSTQQVLTTEQGPCITVPIMVFGEKETPRFASLHNDPSVVEMKIASAIARRILIDTRCSVDIITWDCLKKLTHP